MAIKDCPNITAQYACLIDKFGNIIYERNAYDSAKIASLTKIMTAIIALENSNLDEKLTISKKSVEVGESSAGFWVDDKLDMQSALYAMLVPSGNDAAQAISEFVGQKIIDSKDDRIRKKTSEEVTQEAQDREIDEEEVEDVYISNPDEAFCVLMNLKASEIGCVNTNFTNAHGLADDEFYSEDQRSCAVDIALITKYAMTNELFRKIVAGGDTVINVERNGEIIPLELNSTDILLGNFEGCIGVKTGNTEIGGPCFSGALEDTIDGTEIYTIVLKSEDEAKRFIDTQDLFNWYITYKVDINLADTSEKETMIVNDEEKEVGVCAYISHSEWPNCTFPVTIKDEDKQIPVLSIAGNVHLKIEPSEIKGSFKAGDKVAEMVLTQHNREITRVDLISVKDQPGPNVIQMIGVAFDRLGRNISGEKTVAETQIISNCDKINQSCENNN